MDISNNIKIMGFDPGESTGVSYFKYGLFRQETIVKDFTGIAASIASYKPDIVVVEEFVLYPNKARHLSWNDMYASQVIGVIKYICEVLDIPVVMQQANVKKFVDYSKCEAKNDHEKDAYAHTWFYIKKNKLAEI